MPERPFSPNRGRINLLGIAAGLLIGLGITALLEYLDNTLKTEADVRQQLKLPVIATIPILLHDERAPRGARTGAGWRTFAGGAGLARLAAVIWTGKW